MEINWSAIVLGIILLILIYIIYRLYIVDNSKVAYADLSKNQKSITDIDKPSSAQFTYYCWIYVESWANAINKPIITMKGKDNEELMTLKLAQTQALLQFDIKTLKTTTKSDGTKTTEPTIETVEITNNFPLQSWVHVAICVNSQLVDTYLNGKLVKSKRLNDLPVVNTASNQSLILGDGTDNDKLKIYVARFTRLASYKQPDDVWKNYLLGSGQGSKSNNYGVQVSILQGGSVTQVFDILKS